LEFVSSYLEEERFVTQKEITARFPALNRFLGAFTGEFRDHNSFQKARVFSETAHRKGFGPIVVFSTNISRSWIGDGVKEDSMEE